MRLKRLAVRLTVQQEQPQAERSMPTIRQHQLETPPIELKPQPTERAPMPIAIKITKSNLATDTRIIE
jgi:hypothetical protein